MLETMAEALCQLAEERSEWSLPSAVPGKGAGFCWDQGEKSARLCLADVGGERAQ